MTENECSMKNPDDEVIDEKFLARFAIESIKDFVKEHNDYFKDDPDMQLDIDNNVSKALIMWEFVRQFCFSNNKCGFKMINYDQFLYPDYAQKFEKKQISTLDFAKLQKSAKELLENHSPDLDPKVVAHWQSIVDGKAPFGYEICNPFAHLKPTPDDKEEKK